VDANADESPQRLFTETEADLDGGGPKSVHNPHWNGNQTLIKTARMETTNEDTARKSVINTPNVPDAANMEECFTNASESEAPDYSSVLCIKHSILKEMSQETRRIQDLLMEPFRQRIALRLVLIRKQIKATYM
jgi:predicted Rossmann fold nucleotide-binding protein DprA/Smf involved in DNA uptake